MKAEKMASVNRKEIAVVGGGLAGTAAAYALIEMGHRVVHFDKRLPGAASEVAAGMFNIITGKDMKLTWCGLELIELLRDWQKHLPETCQPCIHWQPVVRPFVNAEEAQKWSQVAKNDYKLSTYLSVNNRSSCSLSVKNPYGALEVKAGWVEIDRLLNLLKTSLRGNLMYKHQSSVFLYKELNPEKVSLSGVVFEHVLFAEGYRAIDNPYWPVEPLRPLKGEVLILRFSERQRRELPVILSRGGYLVQRPDGTATLGTTYGRGQTDIHTTLEGRAALLKKLEGLVHQPEVEILDQQVGIRPTVKDHRPILGRHPKYPNLWFMNGLGNKGLLNTPLLIKHLPDMLADDDARIPKAIRLDRLKPKSASKLG